MPNLPWMRRLLLYGALSLLLLWVGIIVILRYWWLPGLDSHKAEIERALSEAAGQSILIGRIAGQWYGIRPYVEFHDIEIRNSDGTPALYLKRIQAAVAWRTLFVGSLRLHSLLVDQPTLVVHRDPNGQLRLAGMALAQSAQRAGFGNWLLKQDEVVVHEGTVQWQDDSRGAPELVLRDLNMRLENSGSRHRFGIQAALPEALALPLDLRGDVHGASLEEWSEWRGRLFAQVDYTDMAAWNAWVSLPFELSKGSGRARLWLDFDAKKVSGVIADAVVRDVNLRLLPHLPVLQLTEMNGRVSWQKFDDGFSFSTDRLTLHTREGLDLPQGSFVLEVRNAEKAEERRTRIRASNLEFEPLVALANYLPVEGEVIQFLSALSPQGVVTDAQVEWQGVWNAPTHYSMNGQFRRLGLNAYDNHPGFEGLDGTLRLTEQGGSLSLNSHAVRLDLPGVFEAPIALDSLTTKMRWNGALPSVQLKIENMAFSNSYHAGTLQGEYEKLPDSPGWVDLTAHFTHVDARHVSPYVPLVVGEPARRWLARSLVAGKSESVHMRLEGDLKDFPFPEGNQGTFEVTARVEDGILDYAEGWPRLENVRCDLLFEGKRMEVISREATMLGARLEKVSASIPDLLVYDERLDVEGETRVLTHNMVRFINASPVDKLINGLTRDTQAAGTGRLALQLHLPLRHMQDSQVTGAYRFADNRIVLQKTFPALDHVDGELKFADSSLSAKDIKATVLGGQATINVGTSKEGAVHIDVTGKLTATGIAQSYATTLAKELQGAAAWRANFTFQGQTLDFVAESSLRGMALNLPFPFNKRAQDAMELRIERKTLDPQRDLVWIRYGQLAAGQFLHRADSNTIERGVIHFGQVAELPAKPGIKLVGTLPQLDFDRWRVLMDSTNDSEWPLNITGVDLKIGLLDVFNRRFNNFRLEGYRQADGWQTRVSAREFSGEVGWQPAGQGKLTVRFKSFTLPAPMPQIRALNVDSPQSLPALDIVVDNLASEQQKSAHSGTVGSPELSGRLELKAYPQKTDWHIEKLSMTNPEDTLELSGLWRDWERNPRPQVKIHITVRDIGKKLAREGYPGSVKGGRGQLDGQLSWTGSPWDVNYSNLSGTLTVKAQDGQFLKIDPGIGKLLGTLSLQALPRRITLDFRDVFSDGFAFDEIATNLRIAKGVAYTDDFRMQGPAALVKLKGKVDFVGETQDLQVSVTPRFEDSVSVASAFAGGPIVGLGVLVAQKVLKDPLGQMTSFDYDVSGTWENPEVSKRYAPQLDAVQ